MFLLLRLVRIVTLKEALVVLPCSVIRIMYYLIGVVMHYSFKCIQIMTTYYYLQLNLLVLETKH